MVIVPKGSMGGIALIDPKKKQGEQGQYVLLKGSRTELAEAVAAARLLGKEVRYYFKDVVCVNGEKMPAKVVITEIPPGHVQPFHAHDTVHEVSTVDEGEVIAVESETLTEDDAYSIKKQGVRLYEGDMMVADPGKKHTIANLSDVYARFTTVQVARVPYEEFSADWRR